MTKLTQEEELAIAREAIAIAHKTISECQHAETRLSARKMLDEAEVAAARGTARPSLAWSCRAVQKISGYRSEAYSWVQAKYDAVYDSHMAEG